MSATAVAWASHALGRFSDELAATRATRRAFPDIAAYRAEELRAMAALGMTDSVRAGLDDLVSRWGPLQGADAAQMLIRHLRGHGHPEAARAVGQSCVDFFFADSSNMATYAAYFGAVCLHAVGRPAQAARVLERVVGHVAGKAGSFVLQRTGTFENGVAKETYIVVPGSGTGELRDLRGEGESAVGHGTEHPFTLHYALG